VLQYEADSKTPLTPEKHADVQEILNYRTAMNTAIDELQKRPICINMIRDLHRILLTSTRGRDREPGEIRRIQNYIAPPGTPIEGATFVPPSPPMVMDALSNWEIYLHSEEKDTLVQLAILKAQFELIHPFRDGNGRIGRMLVPLILYSKKMLSSPMFYISAYLERNRDEYYERLLAISRDGDWNAWISFFLRAVMEQAEENSQRATHILRLYDDMKQAVPEITRSKYSIQAIDAIFSRPIFRPADFIGYSNIPKDSAQRILRELKNARVLEVLRERQGRRPAVYVFPQLIAISEGLEVVSHP
jgi:Fic family protein